MSEDKYPVIITSDTRKNDHWVKGTVDGGFTFSAKVFDEGSEFGINGFRISKLDIRKDNVIIVNYDRGWDVIPIYPEHKDICEAVMTKMHGLDKVHGLQEFDVTITETLQKTVTVEAYDLLGAEQIVNEAWDNSEYILDADSFVGVEFEAKPAEREITRDVEPHEKGTGEATIDNQLKSEIASIRKELHLMIEQFNEEHGDNAFDKLYEKLSGHNYDGELFDFNYGTIASTIHNDESGLRLSDSCEVWDDSGLINTNYEWGKEEINIMTENTTPQGDNSPLVENEYVKQLFGILQENGRDSSGLAALIGHVTDMESFVKRAEDKIADMKSQLAEMKEVQNHPVKTYLQNAIKALETKVAEMKERIGELKTSIIEGCKSAVQAFKDKGIAALNNLASFFGIKKILQSIKNDAVMGADLNSKAMVKIESFSQEYHKAGRALKNMARVAVGKKPIDTVKEAGKLARVMCAPYKAAKAINLGIKKQAEKAIAKLEQLGDTAAEKKAERELVKKPSMLEKLAKNQERVAEAKREAPIPERTKAQGLDV